MQNTHKITSILQDWIKKLDPHYYRNHCKTQNEAALTEFVVEQEVLARQKIEREMEAHIGRKVSCIFVGSASIVINIEHIF